MTVFNRCTHILLGLSERLLLSLIEHKLIHEVFLTLDEPTLFFLSLQIELHIATTSLLINQHVVEGGYVVLVA